MVHRVPTKGFNSVTKDMNVIRLLQRTMTPTSISRVIRRRHPLMTIRPFLQNTFYPGNGPFNNLRRKVHSLTK